MANPPTFEEWLTPEMENISRDRTQVGQRYYDRAGNAISSAESLWLSKVNPGYSIVRHTHFPDSGMVSTVHLHFNYAWAGGPILLFETMVFGVDGWDDWQTRYTTEVEAVTGHDVTVAQINAGESPKY